VALATPIVTVNGAALPPSVLLVSAEVVREVGRVPHARLVFDDGEVPAKRLAALDMAALVPGAAIAIDVRVGTRTTLLFRGLLIRLRMELRGGVPRLIATCKDQAWALTRPRRSAIYPDSSDADAVGTILTRAGVRHGDLGGDAIVHEELVQWDATDWDFILSRAAANGLAVVVKNGALSMRNWAGAGAPVLDLEYGRDPIDDIELEFDAGGQGEDIDAVGWDPAAGALTEPATGTAFATGQGDLDPAGAAADLGLGPTRLSHLAPLSPGELRAWAGGRLARERLAMLRGRLRLAGVAVEPLDRIKLGGVGKRFNGPALVGGVRHVVEANAWSTDLQLGLPAAPPPTTAPAEPLLPPARGLAIGLVEEPEEDPLGERRVRVRLPGLVAGGDAHGVVWARMATPEAGAERGVSFRPRAGDEVVVGFLADDPRHPVVLGAMFGSRVPPYAPFAAADAEVARGFGSAAASVEMIEGEDKGSLRLRVAKSSLTIALADGAETITLADANGNALVMDKEGIRLTSAKAFVLKASGEATVEAKSFGVEASGEATVKAGSFGVDASGKVMIEGASVALN
jgi:Rhs element Vgr protein